MSAGAPINDLVDIRRYIDAATHRHCVFTLVSKKTGSRYTYRVRKGDHALFVDLLTGPDNRTDWTYVGARTDHGFKGAAGVPPPASIVWFFQKLDLNDAEGLAQVEFWHQGNCSRCGHPLTDPESIARGLGPICATKVI
jgi:hypothetical protein